MREEFVLDFDRQRLVLGHEVAVEFNAPGHTRSCSSMHMESRSYVVTGDRFAGPSQRDVVRHLSALHAASRSPLSPASQLITRFQLAFWSTNSKSLIKKARIREPKREVEPACRRRCRSAATAASSRP
jgi:hypothetical protein